MLLYGLDLVRGDIPSCTLGPPRPSQIRREHLNPANTTHALTSGTSHYHQRSNVETTFSMIKAKFGDSLRSKSEVGQFNEVLCKVIARNLCCLISAVHELGLAMPQFSQAPLQLVR